MNCLSEQNIGALVTFSNLLSRFYIVLGRNSGRFTLSVCSRPFCKFFGDFWVYLRIGVVLKLVFEVKNW